jgi:hypothetical protein
VSSFSWIDLYAVGVTLDVCGAAILANGLFIRPQAAVLVAGSFWGGNPAVAGNVARDRIDGSFGLAYLACGFGLQAVGYLVQLGLDPQTPGSVGRVLAAVLLMGLTGSIAVSGWQWTRPWFVRRRLVEMARYRLTNVDAPATREALPFAGTLAPWARAAKVGGPQATDETDRAYVRRVFGVEAQEGSNSDSP